MNTSEDTVRIARESRYGRIASLYEWGAYWGSGGQIQESKKYHLNLVTEPSRILYPGVGWGKEVVLAAKAGHHPTVVELDSVMFEKSTSIFKAEGVLDKIECIQGNVLNHQRSGEYDVVVASYLLDVFSPNVMFQVYEHLVNQLKDGGMLTLSGYAPLNGSFLHRMVQTINHAYANLFCKLVVNNAVHGIYDYSQYYSKFRLTPVCERDFPHFATFGPRFHRFWAARKSGVNPGGELHQ
ncbi:MAG: class I SAM-dependent methyltransferase [Ketobacteraceae bacterium]|nr:class I SAM-dependent methyltransferase [Ketobacteraceae bacterium]